MEINQHITKKWSLGSKKSQEIKNAFQLCDNENTYQNMWDTVKTIRFGRNLQLYSYIEKGERFNIRRRWKKEQIKDKIEGSNKEWKSMS